MPLGQRKGTPKTLMVKGNMFPKPGSFSMGFLFDPPFHSPRQDATLDVVKSAVTDALKALPAEVFSLRCGGNNEVVLSKRGKKKQKNAKDVINLLSFAFRYGLSRLS